MPPLAERYRVVCPDLRGAGWTEAPAKGYRRDQLLADVVALPDALRLDRVRLIGHDWGALLGYQLCLGHPDRVAKYLCLAGPPPFLRFDPRFLTVMWRLWFQVVIATPGLGPRLLDMGDQRLARYLLDQTCDHAALTEHDVELFVAPLRDPTRAHAGSEPGDRAVADLPTPPVCLRRRSVAINSLPVDRRHRRWNVVRASRSS